MPIKADDINAELEPLGYHYHASPQGGHHVSALYGHTYNKFFETDQKLEKFVSDLQSSDQWRLEYSSGGVDIDRSTGNITPHDGSPPYNARNFSMYGGTHPTYDAPNADYIQTTSIERPPYGGNWFKVRTRTGN